MTAAGTRAAAGATPRAALITGVNNANVQVSPMNNTTDRFSETAVAVDPNDSTGQHLVAASNFTTSTPLASYQTVDAGLGWGETSITGDPARVSELFDPGVAFDKTSTGGNHTLFSFAGIDQQGHSEIEVERLNPDNSTTIALVDPKENGDQGDKPMIATDPRTDSGRVYVGYDATAIGGQPLEMVASSSSGTGWTSPVDVWNSGGSFGPWPAVAGDGTAYVVWDDFCGNPGNGATATTCPKPNGQILITKSTDGGASWASELGGSPVPITATTAGAGSILPNYSTECTQGCPARTVNPSPQLAIDHSGGARNGTLYVVYGDGSDPSFGASAVPSTHRMHIFLQESKDGGATWSSRIQIDSGNVNNDSWEPSVAVDQSNGNVVVSWYDRRDDASNHLYVPYFTESLSDSNGLAQFTAQLPVGSGQSDPQVDCNGTGDYQQIAAVNGTAHPVWTDSRNGRPTIFTQAIDETAASTATSNAVTTTSAVRPATGTGWLALPGGARDIGVGADCTAWIIGQNAIAGGGQTWVWGGPFGQGWIPVNGGGVRISVQLAGFGRVVNSSNAIFRQQQNGSWLQAPGGGTDIGSGADGSLWIIGLDKETGGHGVWAFNSSGGWTFAGGAGERIAVGPDGFPWVVNESGQIWHLTPGGWANVPGGARDIGVGADGSVWIIGLNAIAGGFQTWHYNGTGWDAVNGGGVAISVGADGMPWVVNSAGQIFERV